MNFDSFQTYSGQAAVDFLKFYNSPFFSVIKFILGVYAIVIIADIVLLIIQRGLSGNVREAIIGMNIPRELTTKKKLMRAKWREITDRLKGGNESEYKVAIIEADNIIDKLVKNMTYPGKNMGERLNNIPKGQIESVEELKKAHEIRNRIIHEENFQVSREYAKETLKKYEAFLEEFEVL
jgi:ABC-type lipoprotein release transport system permease subunit